MFKIKTSLIQGFAALLITSSSLWATPHHDDDNAQVVVSRGMEAPAIQGSSSIHTSPSTSNTSTDLVRPALDSFVPVTVSEGVIASAARQSTDLSTAASDCHVTSFLAVTVSESVIASAARQSTDLITADKVLPRKWSPFQHQDGWANLPRLLIDEVFQWLMSTGDLNNIKNAAFISRHWHRYTQSMEFKNLFLNVIQELVGDDSFESDDAPGKYKHLFKDHRKYFYAMDNQSLIRFVQGNTFKDALEITSFRGQRYRTCFDLATKVTSDPQAKCLDLHWSCNSPWEMYSQLALSPTVHFDLSKITELNLSQNSLEILPDLRTMTNLQILKLSNNRFQLIPEIIYLKKLRVAELEENPLCDLPDLTLLTNLWRVGIDASNLNVLSALRTAPALEYLRAYSSALNPAELRDFMGREKCKIELLSLPPKRSLELHSPGSRYY